MLTGPDGRYHPTEAELAKRPVALNEGRWPLSCIDNTTGERLPVELLELQIPVQDSAMGVVDSGSVMKSAPVSRDDMTGEKLALLERLSR